MNTSAPNTRRLFTASRIAVGATAARFVAISAIMVSLKNHFGLDNEQVGWIGGAGLWGFTLTMLVFGSLCDLLGMKLVFRLAMLAHLAGVMAMCLANGFIMLFGGSLLLSMGDGLVQAAGNPLVVTLFPDRKTEMMNKFHLWFPGGIVICGLIAFALDKAVPDVWQAKLAMIFVPTVLYGTMFFGQRFPTTERVQLGVSFGQMFRETFFRPLFLLLALCMMMTASVELGPNTWLTPVLESAGIPGILVLVWISLLMALLRQLAGPMVRKLAPLGILFCSAVLSGLGLLGLSYSQNLVTALAAGTVFAVGVAYLWPTMIGFTSERVPKGGGLALAMMGSVGMVAVGLVTVPMMGRVADSRIYERLPARETALCLRQIVETYPSLMSQTSGKNESDICQAAKAAQSVIAGWIADGTLPQPETAIALRSAIAAAPQSEAAHTARELIGPGENFGGRVAFRGVAVLTIILAAIFGFLWINDRIGGSATSCPP